MDLQALVLCVHILGVWVATIRLCLVKLWLSVISSRAFVDVK
jgi:hypothetical protein